MNKDRYKKRQTKLAMLAKQREVGVYIRDESSMNHGPFPFQIYLSTHDCLFISHENRYFSIPRLH